jgi:sec-independent protein translocase protein TatB
MTTPGAGRPARCQPSMIDFGFDKIALIGAVALIVIGPEKLPKVARTVGHLLGKAQRYVADVKAEVNRSIELEELKKMKTQFEDAARDVERRSQRVNAAQPAFKAFGHGLKSAWTAGLDGTTASAYEPLARRRRATSPRRRTGA